MSDTRLRRWRDTRAACRSRRAAATPPPPRRRAGPAAPCEADFLAADAATLLLPLDGDEAWERPFEHPLVDLLDGAIDFAMDPRAVPAAVADELVPWALGGP